MDLSSILTIFSIVLGVGLVRYHNWSLDRVRNSRELELEEAFHAGYSAGVDDGLKNKTPSNACDLALTDQDGTREHFCKYKRIHSERVPHKCFCGASWKKGDTKAIPADV